jgi:uncharacterized membrane protein (UPF0127 family)
VAWLVRDGDVLAAVEIVDSRRGRARAVIGLKDHDGAVLLRRRPLLMHTLRARISVDVAFCDGELEVRDTARLGPLRLARPRPGSASVIVVRGGAFERWGLLPGDRVEVKGG